MVASCVTVAVLTGAFIALAAQVWETNGVVGLDRTALRLRHSGAVDRLVGSLRLRSLVRPDEVVRLGSSTFIIPVAVAIALVALAWRDRIGAVVAVVGPGATFVVTEYLAKPVINMPNPVGARAFPSGHSGGTAAVALVAVIVVYRRWGGVAALVAAPVVAVPVLLVDIALLDLDYHYPTDVLGGVLLAALIVFGLTAVLSLYRGPGDHVLRPPEPSVQFDPSIRR